MTKTAIVTGASSGYGAAIAKKLCEQQYHVVLAAPMSSPLKKTTKNLHKQFRKSPEPTCMDLDLSETESIDKFVTACQELGEIDVLVNNAGILTTTAQTNSLGLDKSYMVNQLGPFYLTNKLLPLLRKTQEPFVVNIAGRISPFRVKVTPSYFDDLSKWNYEDDKYQGASAYHQTNMYNVWWSVILHKHYIPTVAISPGMCASTNLFHELPFYAQKGMKWVGYIPAMRRTPKMVADLTWNAINNRSENMGKYLDQNGKETTILTGFDDESTMAKFWNRMCATVGMSEMKVEEKVEEK